MPGFDLDEFIKDPSFDQIDKCRKEDLHAIAAYFKISVSKSQNKEELKALVVAGLVETEILFVVPDAAALHEKLGEHERDGEREHGIGGTPPSNSEGDDLHELSPPPGGDSAESGHLSQEEPEDVRFRIAQMKQLSEEKVQMHRMELEHQYKLKKAELEADAAVRMKELELSVPRGPKSGETGSSTSTNPPAFDISKCIPLVPIFRETEVDCYFSAFERIASALKWPKESWALILQCKIQGKAQEVVAALPLQDSLSYDTVKTAVLNAYELVPEAYRQKFRNHKKDDQTYVEFAREKGNLFDKWCVSSKVNGYNALRELILLEEFKKCLPERIVVYLNEQKVESLSRASILADEFVLTHKMVYSSSRSEKSNPSRSGSVGHGSTAESSVHRRDERECYYCNKTGHVIANCFLLKRGAGKDAGAEEEGLEQS